MAKKKQAKYSFYFIAFDIETATHQTLSDERIQITYLGCLKIFNSNAREMEESLPIYKCEERIYFRTIRELLEILRSEQILKYVKKGQKILTFAHNLDYELTFILKELPVNAIITDRKDVYNDYQMIEQQMVARSKHSPLSVVLETLEHIEYRCTYAVSNKSISEIGKEVKLPKLEYDYKIPRLPTDEMTSHDYEYVERDVDISAHVVYQTLDRGFTIEHFPLTFTSITVSNRAKFINEHFDKKEITKYSYKLTHSYFDYDFYQLCNNAFFGGTTTANPLIVNQKLNYVWSGDIKSSYPFVGATFRFPYFHESSTQGYEGDEADTLYHEQLEDIPHYLLTDIKGYIGQFTFYNVRIKNEQLPPTIAINRANKTGRKNVKSFNGKLVSCEQITYCLTNVGLDCFNEIYDYDGVYCSELYTTTRSSYLPIGEILFILECFCKKETLDKDDAQRPYFKMDVNSMFGIKVQKFIKDLNQLINGEIITTEYYDESENSFLSEDEKRTIYDTHVKKIKERGTVGGRWDIFSDGLYFTDYARYRLIEIMKLFADSGFHISYTDTDSIHVYKPEFEKTKPSKEEIERVNKFVKEILNDYNQKVIEDNENNFYFQTYRQLINPNMSDKDYHKMCCLGIVEIETYDYDEYWDDENEKWYKVKRTIQPYIEKTLGAKKYGNLTTIYRHELDGTITERKELNTTISGCSKKVNETITHIAQKENIELDVLFDKIFKPNTLFDESCSGRTVAYYEKRTREEIKNDFIRREDEIVKIDSFGGIIIDDTTYHLNLSENDCDFLGLEYSKDRKLTVSKDGYGEI